MRHFLMALTLSGATLAGPMAAQEGKVVVELFTSQGCASCPPADALLVDLAQRDDVIALALHVDYWDYLGWKDTFSAEAFTARQHGYANAANARMIYTPQMVVGGVDHVVGSKAMEVMDQIAQHREAADRVALTVVRNGETLQINAEPRGGDRGPMVVQLVRYYPVRDVAIPRGENAGISVRYVNTVTSWDVIGRWDGHAPLAMTAQIAGTDPAVVIIQRERHGPILAAVELR